MKSGIRNDPAKRDMATYLKRHRYGSSSVWVAIMRRGYRAVGLYDKGGLIGLAAVDDGGRNVRIHGGDAEFARSVLAGLGEGTWHLFDVPYEYGGALHGLGETRIEEPATLYVRKDDEPLPQDLSEDIGTLRPGHAGLVHNRWGLDDDEGMVDLFRRRIAGGPTSAVYVHGTPVAWAGAYHATPWVIQLGYLYVEREHRRKGYGRAVSVDMINKTLRKGKVPVIHVFDSNDASRRLVETLGFEPVERRAWGGLTIGKT